MNKTNEKKKDNCARCGDRKVLTNGGMFCEDCKLALEYDEDYD